MRRSWIAVIVAVLVGAFAVAGCGGSSSKAKTNTATSSGGGTSSTASTTKAATGTPLKVMVISASGDPIYSWPTVWTLAKDAADSINAGGGINNHPIDVITCNDQANPSDAIQCAREAVSDKVVALVGGLTLYPQAYSILQAARIPWVGDLPVTSSGYTDPLTWAFNPSPFQYVADGYLAGKECKTVAAVRSGVSTDAGLYNDFAVPGLALTGKKFTTLAMVPATQTDFSGTAAQVASAGSKCFYLQLADQQSVEMVKALQANGTDITAYAMDGTFTQEVASAATQETNGAIIASVFPPANTAPAWAAARAAIAKYSGAGSVDITNANVLGVWPAFQVFANVAKTIKGAITSKSLIKALNHATSVSSGGVLPKMDLAKPFPDPSFARLFDPYVVVNTVENGKIVNKTGFVNYTKIFLQAQKLLK